jgi:hypothetical protein
MLVAFYRTVEIDLLRCTPRRINYMGGDFGQLTG